MINFNNYNLKSNFHSSHLTLNTTFEKSEIVIILGPNNYGKSYFLNDILKKEKGISYDTSLSYFFKNTLVPYHTILQTVKLYYESQNILFNDNELLKEFKKEGLREDLHINDLSYGSKQKVNLFLCLKTRATIYLLDEPSLGLDLDSVNLLKSKILDLSAKGAVFFIVTHDYSLLKIGTTLIFISDVVNLIRDDLDGAGILVHTPLKNLESLLKDNNIAVRLLYHVTIRGKYLFWFKNISDYYSAKRILGEKDTTLKFFIKTTDMPLTTLTDALY